jgi:predicted nucleic acid-binding protein
MRCLDASFLIDLQGGVPEASHLVQQWEREKTRVAVPIPAYVEWLRSAYLRGGKALSAALELAENLEVLPADVTVGNDAARLGAELMRRGRILSAADLLIAALVRHHRGVLITRDLDFSDIPGLAVEHY